jgi:RNA polymerase sigma-70 factor, ECF subfamily
MRLIHQRKAARHLWEGPVEAATVNTAAVHDLDLELVARHRYGDAQAFEEIYGRFAHMVYNLALRLSGGDGELAADLTQEIFLRVFRYIGQFRGRSSLKTWVFRIAINHCRSSLGRRHLLTQPFVDEPGEGGVLGLNLPDPSRGPEDLAVAADETRRVAAALAQVPPKFREAVVLRDLEGLSYEEIAEVLGVRVGTVRSRIARGREQLRTLLEASA